MEKVIGVVEISIIVDCPHCDEIVNLMDLEDEGELGAKVFGSSTNPGQWDDLNMVFDCPDCKQKFKLTELEY